MILLIETANGELPTHYILNNKCETAFNTSYNDLEAYHEAIIVDSIIYGKENIVSGEIEDLGSYTLVNELDVVTGSDSKANNKDKIIYGKAKKTS
tara:strand:- start:109 stop:393 length:285 start_codon:yes stop_codon:yes gene_type:complete